MSSNSAEQVAPGETLAAYLQGRPRLARWRVRSRACAVVDRLFVAAGATVMVLTAVDDVVTWPADKVLLPHIPLSGVAGTVGIPGNLWLILSGIAVVGGQKRNATRQDKAVYRSSQKMLGRIMFPTRRMRLGFALTAVLCLVVIVGGFIAGADKGKTQVLPGPRYEISTSRIDNAAWTPISAAEYARWQARFVRLDGGFTLFGLMVLGGSLGFLRLHRAARSSTD